MKEKIVALGLSIILLGGVCIPVWATTESELRDEKKQIQSKIDEAKDQQTEVKQVKFLN